MFPAIFNPLNRPARDQKSGVARIPIGGPIIRDSRRTTRNRKLVKTAWALARASWHLASARLGTLALGPYVWERCLSGFRPTHGRRFRANNCLPFSLSLSPSLLLLLCLPSNSRTTIHSFDIFSTTFFFFFSFLSHGKSSDLRIHDKKFYETMEKQGILFYSSMLRDLIHRHDYFWLIRIYDVSIYLSNPIFFRQNIDTRLKIRYLLPNFFFGYTFHHQEYFPSKFLSLKVR